MMHFCEVPRVGKLPATARREVTEGTPAERSECGLACKGDGVPVWDEEKVLETDGAIDAQQGCTYRH